MQTIHITAQTHDAKPMKQNKPIAQIALKAKGDALLIR